MSAMPRSVDRLLTTHVGSLPRPADLLAARYAHGAFLPAVARENVVTRVDCGFSSQACYRIEVHPTVIWAKFEGLRGGAPEAGQRLWRVRT